MVPLGWYMALDADRGEEMTSAVLQSPVVEQASAPCTLHFYYNMCGDSGFLYQLITKQIHMNPRVDTWMEIFVTFSDSELSVLLKRGSRTSVLWWLSGDHGDLWQHGEVVIGRVPQNFTILFEASRDINQPGHIAIDDVSFTNCSFPGRLFLLLFLMLFWNSQAKL